MDKKALVSKSIQNLVSEALLDAIANGELSKVIGDTTGIAVGKIYEILSADYKTGWFARDRDSTETAAEIAAKVAELGEDAAKEDYVKRGWACFKTNNGDLSFSAIMGNTKFEDAEFWNDAEKSEDFDVEKIFRPSARAADVWLKKGCDELIGKKVRCVATKVYNENGLTGIKARAFVTED